MVHWVTVSISSFLTLTNKCTGPSQPQVCSVWAQYGLWFQPSIVSTLCLFIVFILSFCYRGWFTCCPPHPLCFRTNSDALKLDLHIEYPLRSRPPSSSSKTLPAYFLLPPICLFIFAHWWKRLCGLCLSRNCPFTARDEHCGGTVAWSHLCSS